MRVQSGRRRVRDGWLPALGSRQCLFHGHRTEQAHRILRYAPVAHRRGRDRGGAGARAGAFPAASRAPAVGGVVGVAIGGVGASRLACAPAGLLLCAGRALGIAGHGAAAVRGDRAGLYVLHDAARGVVVEAPRARGGRFRGRPFECGAPGGGAGQALSGQREHLDAGSRALGVLRFASAGARADFAAEPDGGAAADHGLV